MASELNPSRLCAAVFVALLASLTIGACTGDTSPDCLTDDDCSGESVCWTGGDEHICVENCTGSGGSQACTAEEICTQPNALSEQQGCVPRAEYRSDAGHFDSGQDLGDTATDAGDGG